MLDRAGAKAAATGKEDQDSDLSDRMHAASNLQSQLAEYQHLQASKLQDLGSFGKLLGGEKSAPIAVASIALIISFLVFLALHTFIAFGQLDADHVKILVSAADKSLALTTLALGYVCGKSS